MYKEEIMCHGSRDEFNYGHPAWEKRDSGYRHCSYCGSIHPEDLLILLENGARLQGADWKYGYPHKFYVQDTGIKTAVKFYTTHMKDLLGEPEFEQVARAILDKQDGLFYPKVAFIAGEQGIGYVSNVRTYEEALRWATERGVE